MTDNDNEMISPTVIDAAVWALLGYSEAQRLSLKQNPRLDWSIGRTWTLSVAREQVALALKAAVDIFPTEQASEIQHLRRCLSDLLQFHDGVPLHGMESERRIGAARDALRAKPE
jgi:hypothetical protein